MPDGSSFGPDRWSEIRRWVSTNCGIVLEHARGEVFSNRLDALQKREGIGPSELLFKLRSGDRRWALAVADAASTNYTQFFRERDAFDILSRDVYPRLPDGPLRMWSAAASTGEEGYSMAIHVCEQLGAAAARRVKILGTDISDRHIATAEKALYSETRLSHLTPQEQQYFERVGMGQSRIRADIRSMCTFRQLNLLAPEWPFSQPFHVIFCRNVLYYFEHASRTQIFEQCFDCAAPGAFLIASFTDPTSDIVSRWTPIRPGVFRKDRS